MSKSVNSSMTIFSCFSLESCPCFDSLNTFFSSLNFLVKFCLTLVLKFSFTCFSSWKNQHLFPLLHPFIWWKYWQGISFSFSLLLVLLSSCFIIYIVYHLEWFTLFQRNKKGRGAAETFLFLWKRVNHSKWYIICS